MVLTLRCPVQLILSLLREKVERKPLGVEELAAAAVAASSAEPLTKARDLLCHLRLMGPTYLPNLLHLRNVPSGNLISSLSLL